MQVFAAVGFLVVVGCGITHAPGADAAVDGGTAGQDAAGGHWTIGFDDASRDPVTLAQLFAAADGSRTDVASWPGPSDPWFDAVAPISRTGDVMRGDASAHVAFDLAIADDVLLTLTVVQTDDPTSEADATIVFQPTTLCYGPVSGANSVVFTFSCGGTSSASGSGASVQAGAYSGTTACDVGTTDVEGMHITTNSVSATATVRVGPDGMACATDVQVRAGASPLSFDTSASRAMFTGTVRIHAN